HRFFDPVILSLDLKVNIQEAKRVPQLLLQNSSSRNNQKQRQHFIFWMKPPAHCGGIDSGSEAESWWRVPTGCHVVTRWHHHVGTLDSIEPPTSRIFLPVQRFATRP